MKYTFVLALLLMGCPVPPPRPVFPITTTIPLCAKPAILKQADVCDGYFTQDGLACARCINVKGCVDSNVVMYCAEKPCSEDSFCSFTPVTVEFGK